MNIRAKIVIGVIFLILLRPLIRIALTCLYYICRMTITLSVIIFSAHLILFLAKRHASQRWLVKQRQEGPLIISCPKPKVTCDNLEAVGKYLVEAVLPSLTDGLSAYNKISNVLLKVDVDLIAQGTCAFSSIRHLIEQAHQSLECAERTVSETLKDFDECLEGMTAKKYKLKQESDQKNFELDNLRDEQISNQTSLKNYKDSLEQGKRNLDSTKGTLYRQLNREDTAEAKMKTGLKVTLIPVVGWIAGPLMIIGGALDKTKAEKAIKTAEEEVEKFESQVRTYSNKVFQYKSKIFKTEEEIAQTNKQLQQISGRMQEVNLQRETLIKFQMKMRDATRLLGRLSGNANVLECQTRRFILLEPVMKVMEDVVKVAGETAGHQVLQNNGVMSLVDAMRENNRKLAAVCGSHNSLALANYY